MSVEKINLKPINKSDIDFSKIYKNSSDAQSNVNSITVKNTQYWGDNGNQLYYDENSGLVSEEQANGEMVPMGFINTNSLNNVEEMDLSATNANENSTSSVEEVIVDSQNTMQNDPRYDAEENAEEGQASISENVETNVTSSNVADESMDEKDRTLVEAEKIVANYNGEVLTRRAGRINGPSGEETYYNLPMGGVERIMRNAGFSEEEYPYHVREDGVKMLGDYVMCAANLDVHPRGSFVATSLGTGIVCDTGGFAAHNPTQLDIAVDW